ncbi:MAG: hypothetical protein LBK07_04250 [Tannerella sp.]|jgi:hypothetical protein|nr:hypothetical protein [Tannerella sp.]
MGKKQKKTVAARRVSPPVPSPGKREAHGRVRQWFGRAFGLRSLLVAGVVALGVYLSVTHNAGYRWTWEGYLRGNWDFIRQHPDATLEERLQMKLGFDYSFLSYIVKNTPEDAIILFPPRGVITEEAGGMRLTNNIESKMWVMHFVYPRRVVYRDEAETNSLCSEATHVAICATHGYDDLDYAVEQRAPFAVLPKKRE